VNSFRLAILLGCSFALAAATALGDPASGPVNVAVYGDAPYGTSPNDVAEFNATPGFIGSINADGDVSLVLHVGDIHSGKQFCTEAYDRAIFGLWTGFRAPLVYTPGDNEWADCHKTGEGGGSFDAATGQIDFKRDASGNLIDYAGGNPLANLALVRSIFFANPGTTLGGFMDVHTQAAEFDEDHPTDANYVENVWWDVKIGPARVLFVALNLPGGSNNDSDIWYGAPAMSAEQAQEIEERTGADLRWLDKAFKHARSNGTQAVVIQTQADMWDLDGKTPSHISNYLVFIDRIAALATAFGKPVLLLNGDSHVYRSDNPLVAGAPCVTESGASTVACAEDAYANQAPNLPAGASYNVPNFHRLVVHGSTFPLEWVKLTIDPGANAANGADAFGPFRWQRRIVPLAP
jgi:hypothetical protein